MHIRFPTKLVTNAKLRRLQRDADANGVEYVWVEPVIGMEEPIGVVRIMRHSTGSWYGIVSNTPMTFLMDGDVLRCDGLTSIYYWYPLTEKITSLREAADALAGKDTSRERKYSVVTQFCDQMAEKMKQEIDEQIKRLLCE